MAPSARALRCAALAAALADVGSASGGEVRRLEEEIAGAACPSGTLYGAEPTPFGWPLTPKDWSFAREDCWEQAHLICGGERQSPMDLDLSDGAVHCDDGSEGTPGQFARRAAYVPTGPLTVEGNKYMGSVMAKGNFGRLVVPVDGTETEYVAEQVHVVAPSLHSVAGRHYAAEIMVLHRPKSDPDMLRTSVIVSVFLESNGSRHSAVLEGLGFGKDGFSKDGHGGQQPWKMEGALDLNADMKRALEGTSMLYEGSVPVPPCSETVNWVVLSAPQPASPQQVQAVQTLLREVRGTAAQRRPKPRNRCISVNHADMKSDHHLPTCEADYRKGTWHKSAQCWDIKDRCWSKRFSAANIDTKSAVQPSSKSPKESISDIVHYKPVPGGIVVSPSEYSLDARVQDNGNFGHIRVNGHIMFAKNVSFKAVAQHTIDGKRHAGEIIIEHVFYGDTFGEDMPGYDQELHKMMVSIPLELGAPSRLLTKLDLDQSASRTVGKGLSYTARNTIDLSVELEKALAGRWYWYSSNSTHRDCGLSVRWMVFETPLPVSIDQLNMLNVPVSGVDSSELARPVPEGSVFLESLPAFAVEANETACDDLQHMDWEYGMSKPHWDYGNERCWGLAFPVCSEGLAQSPIDVPTEVARTGKDDFLAKCSWKPVSDLQVQNTGHNVQVTSDQMGYVEFMGENGFPDFYQVVQFHVHMPSEHMIGGKQYAAELHVVHKKQNTVLDLAGDDLLVTAIMFDIGDQESAALRQLFLPNGTQSLGQAGAAATMKRPFDPMRAFGPVIDGPFYRYDGSLTTPPCSEVVKWFVFETPLSMSMEQWLAFKDLYPNPHNNRPVQRLNGREVAKDSFEQGQAVDYRFFLNRDTARNKKETNPFLIIFPVIGTLSLCTVSMISLFVREDRLRKRQSSGGLTSEPIGKAAYARM